MLVQRCAYAWISVLPLKPCRVDGFTIIGIEGFRASVKPAFRLVIFQGHPDVLSARGSFPQPLLLFHEIIQPERSLEIDIDRLPTIRREIIAGDAFSVLLSLGV